MWITAFLFLQIVLSSPSGTSALIDPDENANVVEIIESRGYTAKSYYVTTSDGYILTLHRIVNPLIKETLKPVILQHGLIASSADFIINSPGDNLFDPLVNVSNGKNIGFVLSRSGYDVWLPNSRGNTYSRNHTTLDPEKDKRFWEFTFDEHALLDLPATIEFIRRETKSKTVAYIGHSQGSLIMFALLSTRPEYNDIIRPFIALAPVAMLTKIRSPIRYLAHNHVILDFFRWRGGQFLPSTNYMRYLAERVCESAYAKSLCSNLIFLFAGFDVPQLNMTRVPVYFSHTPAGTSAWNMIHYAQGVLSQRFQRFDYGKAKNIERYGSPVPPEYHLERITNRHIGLMSGLNDWLSDPTDVEILKQKLRVPLIYNFQVPYPEWNHLDFIWGKDAGTIINTRIVKLLNTYA